LFGNLIKRSEKQRKTPIFQTLAAQRFRKGGEEQTDRHTVETHVEKERTGSKLSNAKKEGMSRS